MSSVRVALPSHLRTLAGVTGEVVVSTGDEPTIADVLDALEADHPALIGTIRDHVTKERRAYMRYMTCGRDLSHDATDVTLPAEVVSGDEPVRLVGAISGG